MAIGNPYRPPYGANDWTARLPPGSPSADQGMAPGVAVGGWLPVNQLLDPNQVQGQTALPNRLAPWSNFDKDDADILQQGMTEEQAMGPRLTWEQQLAASRPADYSADPRMQANPGYYTPRSFKVWRGGTVRTPGAVATYQDPGEFPAMRWLLPAAREQTD